MYGVRECGVVIIGNVSTGSRPVGLCSQNLWCVPRMVPRMYMYMSMYMFMYMFAHMLYVVHVKM